MELAYTELILSINVKTSNRKIVFILVKGCNSKDYLDGNAATALQSLKNKCEPFSVPSMLKLEKQFRGVSLKKGHDPEVWIHEFENLFVRFEDMGSNVSDNRFIALMEKKIGDAEKLLTVEEIKTELSLRLKFSI